MSSVLGLGTVTTCLKSKGRVTVEISWTSLNAIWQQNKIKTVDLLHTNYIFLRMITVIIKTIKKRYFTKETIRDMSEMTLLGYPRDL